MRIGDRVYLADTYDNFEYGHEFTIVSIYTSYPSLSEMFELKDDEGKIMKAIFPFVNAKIRKVPLQEQRDKKINTILNEK